MVFLGHNTTGDAILFGGGRLIDFFDDNIKNIDNPVEKNFDTFGCIPIVNTIKFCPSWKITRSTILPSIIRIQRPSALLPAGL
jgi:hypothetical protein